MYRIGEKALLGKIAQLFFPFLDSILLTNEHKMKKVDNFWFKGHKNKFLHLKIVVVESTRKTKYKKWMYPIQHCWQKDEIN